MGGARGKGGESYWRSLGQVFRHARSLKKKVRKIGGNRVDSYPIEEGRIKREELGWKKETA